MLNKLFMQYNKCKLRKGFDCLNEQIYSINILFAIINTRGVC